MGASLATGIWWGVGKVVPLSDSTVLSDWMIVPTMTKSLAMPSSYTSVSGIWGFLTNTFCTVPGRIITGCLLIVGSGLTDDQPGILPSWQRVGDADKLDPVTNAIVR